MLTQPSTHREALAQRFWETPLPVLLEQLGTSPAGLSTHEARRRHRRHGPNEPAPPGGNGTAAHLLLVLGNPLALILLLSAFVSALLGEVVSALIIVIVVALGASINFVQTARSRRAVERLRAQTSPTATALRDGTWGEIPRRALVPGDVLRLSAGDLVPA